MKVWKFFGMACAGAFALSFAAFAADVQLVNLPSMPDSKLIHKVTPAYPPDAVDRRTQGAVKFRVTIGNNGHVIGVRLISGNPLLGRPAMQAVRQWVYEPTMVNGNPVRVVTEVVIPFTLDRDGRPLTPPANGPRVSDRAQ
jgi:TonB family protein